MTALKKRPQNKESEVESEENGERGGEGNAKELQRLMEIMKCLLNLPLKVSPPKDLCFPLLVIGYKLQTQH